MKKEIKYLIAVAIAVIVVGVVAASMLMSNKKQEISTQPKSPSFSMVSNLVTAHSYSYGPVDAKVTVVEYFDPECESCSAVAPQIKKEMKFYEGKVRWVFRYMPYHYNSKNAIAALEAAKRQNLFLEAMNTLFETQHEWGEKQVSTKDQIVKIISGLKGINKDQLVKDMEDPAIQAIIEQDKNEGQAAGVRGTPSFFINGVLLERLSLDELIAAINTGLSQ